MGRMRKDFCANTLLKRDMHGDLGRDVREFVEIETAQSHRLRRILRVGEERRAEILSAATPASSGMTSAS